MAIKPRKIRKRNSKIDETIKTFLLTGEAERDTPSWELECSRFFDDQEDLIKTTWDQHKALLLPMWIKEHPGTRPWSWWRHDNPILEPRKRLDGAADEYPGIIEDWDKGVPKYWDEDSINVDDPPAFESEASYLRSHGVLSRSELKYVEEHPELLEPEVVEFDEDD